MTVLIVTIEERATTFALDEQVTVVPVGVGTLLESLLRSDPPAPDELSNAVGLFSDHLDDVVRELPDVAIARDVVLTGPIVHAIAAVELGRADVPPDFVLDRAAAEDVFRTVATESIADRKFNPGLAPAHVEGIVAGCCIVVANMRTFHLDRVTVH